MPRQTRRRGIRHAVAQFAQVVARDATVENALGVVNLTVAHEMDEVGGHPSILRLAIEPAGAVMYIRRRHMYIGEVSKISVTDARGRLPELIDRARTEAVFLERRGKLEAVVLSPEQYDRMMDALEEVEDVAAFDEAMAEEGDSIPWAQVKADLGWT